jgi:hypothetical protein
MVIMKIEETVFADQYQLLTSVEIDQPCENVTFGIMGGDEVLVV